MNRIHTRLIFTIIYLCANCMTMIIRVFPPFTNKSSKCSMCGSSGYSLSHFISLSTQIIGTNINFHKHLSCENFQSRWGALACYTYDLHPSIKTNISIHNTYNLHKFPQLCMDFTIIPHSIIV